MNRKHLSDDRLIERCIAGATSSADEQHLIGCAECEGRRAELAALLADTSDAAAIEADAVFSGERLARQQARILHRIESDGRPGRVIAFPAGHAGEMLSLRTRRTTRWVAAAAAAGLIVGLAAGHLAHDFNGGIRRSVIAQAAVRQQVAGTAMLDVTPVVTDDEFLGQIEAAVDRTGPAALRPLDQLTPRSWEVR